jgi:hypothetical protein
MDFQVLPNKCKKLGLILFFSTSICSFFEGFMEGFNNYPPQAYIKNFLGETLYDIYYILPIFGLLIYMLSKEKIEDEFIQKLRLESYQISIIGFLMISILLFMFNPDILLSLEVFLTFFVLVFLIVFYIKKRVNS